MKYLIWSYLILSYLILSHFIYLGLKLIHVSKRATGDDIWCQRSYCRPTSHNLNQYWLTINEVWWWRTKGVLQRKFQISTLEMSLKITNVISQQHLLGTNDLTHWSLVTPFDDIDLGQYWRRLWLVAWRHQSITWTNVDLSLVRSSDIHQMASP